jgi:DmsE family decaheme c-type cytochrome
VGTGGYQSIHRGSRRSDFAKPKAIAFLFSGLVSLSLLGSGGPASAEYLSFRTDDIRSALLGGSASQPSTDTAALGDFAREIAPAGPRDDAYTALIAYADQVDTAPAKAVEPKAGTANRDEAYDALRDYARGLGAAQPKQADNPHVRVAENDQSLSGALRRLFQGGGAEQSNEPSAFTQPRSPRSPAARAESAIPVRGATVVATIVGSKVCLGCHAPLAAAFSETLMGRIGKTQPGKFECENCHGPGSAHVKAGGGRGVGGIISFRPNDLSRSAKENNAICLGCHEKGERVYWNGSTHESRDLMCTNCHTVMRKISLKHNLRTAWEPETCFQCHKDRRAQLYRSSHMPVREGKMVCSDCHNPHGSFTQALLRENSINDTCYKCHAEKRGPFLFEHTPVRENCDNCHEPHGSVNEKMLKVSRPRLCGECHTFDHGQGGIAGGPGVIQAYNRGCNNCHTQVHGTNSPSGALLLR